jgi:hypothetical protein
MLDQQQNSIFDAYDVLFNSQGWKLFVDETKQNQESIFPKLMSQNVTVEDLYFLKGQNDVYNSILGLQDFMKQFKEDLDEYGSR